MPPHPEQAQLESLCQNESTLKRAQALLTLVKARTGSGTGSNIKNRAGLPAICAFLASQELQNDDVSEEVAQRSSFLDRRAFGATLTVVRTVLHPDDEPRVTRRASRSFDPNEKKRATFEGLAAEHGVSGATVVGMREARDELANSKDKRAIQLVLPKNANLLTCVVFAWACKVVQTRGFNPDRLREAWNLSRENWKLAAATVDDVCEKAYANLVNTPTTKEPRTPSSAARRKHDDLFNNLLKGSASKDKVIGQGPEPSSSPTRPAATPSTPSLQKPTKQVYVELVARARPSASEKEREKVISSEMSSPRPLAAPVPKASSSATASPIKSAMKAKPTSPSKRSFVDVEEDTEMDVDTPTKKPKAKACPVDAGASPTKSLPLPLPLPDIDTPTKNPFLNTPTKSKRSPKKQSPSKSTPRQAPSTSRRLTRSAARNSFAGGSYYESDIDNNSSDSEEAVADPKRNLFTEHVAASTASDTSDAEDEVQAQARVASSKPKRTGNGRETSRTLKGRLAHVFRDRQALYVVDPVLAAKVRAWKKVQVHVQAENEVSEETPMRKPGKRKTRV